MKIKPVPGRIVRDPLTMRKIIDETDVPDNAYWRRRLNDGDVALVQPELTGEEDSQ